MIAGILEFLGSGAMSLFGLLLSLLPSVDLSAVPVALPSQVSAVLGVLNMFIPFADLVGIVTWWAALILAFNVFMIVRQVLFTVIK